MRKVFDFTAFVGFAIFAFAILYGFGFVPVVSAFQTLKGLFGWGIWAFSAAPVLAAVFKMIVWTEGKDAFKTPEKG